MCREASPSEDRGDARLRRQRRPRGGRRPREAFERLESCIAETGRTLVHPYDGPARDRRPGHGRARDPRGRSRRASRRSSRRAAAGSRRASPRRRPAGRRVDRRRAGGLAGAPRGPRSGHAGPRSSRARSPTGSSAPFAGENALAHRSRHTASRACSSRRTRSRRRSGGSTAARSSPASRRPRRLSRRCSRAASRPAPVVRRGLRRQRSCRDRRCYPGPVMKADIHPEYVLANVTLLLRQRVHDALDEARAARRDLLELPPVLHGQAEAAGLRRPGRALPAAAREGRRAAPVAASPRLEHHRRPGRPRGRDDAQPSTWAVAVRTNDGDIAEVVAHLLADGAPPLWRLPVIRGVIALGESLAIGFRALAISANYAAQEEGEDGEVAHRDLARARSSSPSRSRSASR